ncbi:MAG: hypothetical protein OHK0046_44440 [Anaerolineae bacterium]
MADRDKMIKARELMQQKRYEQARAILRTVNHPMAKEWLVQIENLAPASASQRWRNRLTLFILVLFVLVMLAVLVTAVRGADGSTLMVINELL